MVDGIKPEFKYICKDNADGSRTCNKNKIDEKGNSIWQGTDVFYKDGSSFTEVPEYQENGAIEYINKKHCTSQGACSSNWIRTGII